MGGVLQDRLTGLRPIGHEGFQALVGQRVLDHVLEQRWRQGRAIGTGKGRLLDEYLGPRLAPIVMPVYYECIRRRLPAYTIAHIDDVYGRIVAYERLLLPFSDGNEITDLIASLKTISEDGGFEIRNLMRGNDALPVPKLRTIIDRDLFHRAPGRIPSGDVLEFG